MYDITTFTGNVRNAGTDAKVFITLYGDKGVAHKLPLESKVDNFERGAEDNFTISVRRPVLMESDLLFLPRIA